MKKLPLCAVKVNNPSEHVVAIEFYRLATKRPEMNRFAQPTYPRFVGMSENRFVCSAGAKYDYETEIPFNRINELADTDSRRDCLDKAFIKYNMANPHAEPETVKKEKRVVKSRHMPVAEFLYPKRGAHYHYLTKRTVLVIDLNNKYLTGIEDGHFKKFSVSRIGVSNSRNKVTLVGFK